MNSLVDKVANKGTERKTENRRNGNRRSSLADANTSNEEHALEALTQDGDERQQEQGVLLAEVLQAVAEGTRVGLARVQGLAQLHAPLVLQLGDAQEDGAHGGDDEGGAEGKDALPDALCGGELFRAEGVDAADDGHGDDDAGDEAGGGAEPDLFDHLLVEDGVIFGGEGALDEGEEDGDDDGGFEGLAEGDEEDCVFVSG